MTISREHQNQVDQLKTLIATVVREYYTAQGKTMDAERFEILNRYFDYFTPVNSRWRSQRHKPTECLCFKASVQSQLGGRHCTIEFENIYSVCSVLRALTQECDRQAFWRKSGLSNALRKEVWPRLDEFTFLALKADGVCIGLQYAKIQELTQENTTLKSAVPEEASAADSAAGHAPTPTPGGMDPAFHTQLAQLQQNQSNMMFMAGVMMGRQSTPASPGGSLHATPVLPMPYYDAINPDPYPRNRSPGARSFPSRHREGYDSDDYRSSDDDRRSTHSDRPSRRRRSGHAFLDERRHSLDARGMSAVPHVVPDLSAPQGRLFP